MNRIFNYLLILTSIIATDTFCAQTGFASIVGSTNIVQDFVWTNYGWSHPRAYDGYPNCVTIRGRHSAGKRHHAQAIADEFGGHVIAIDAKNCANDTYWKTLIGALRPKSVLYIKDLEIVTNAELQKIYNNTRRLHYEILFVFPLSPDAPHDREQFLNLSIETPDTTEREIMLTTFAQDLNFESDVTINDLAELTDDFEAGELKELCDQLTACVSNRAIPLVTEDDLLDLVAEVLEARAARIESIVATIQGTQ